MGDRVITPKITLGESVKTKVNRSVNSLVYNSVFRSMRDSVDILVTDSVSRSLWSSVNNSMLWGIRL